MGIVSVCQGGITYLLYRKVVRKSSEKERPHTETLPANLSLLPSQEAPTSSLLGRVGAVLVLETFVGCSSLAQATQLCLESTLSLQDGDPQPAVLLLNKTGAGPHAETCSTLHSPFLPPRVPMSHRVGIQLRQSGMQCCSLHHNDSGSTPQHRAGVLATSLPGTAHSSRGFHELSITYGLWWVIFSTRNIETTMLDTAPKCCRKAGPRPGNSCLFSGKGRCQKGFIALHSSLYTCMHFFGFIWDCT